MSRQQISASNPRLLQQMRRPNRPRRDNHLSPGIGGFNLALLFELDPDRALTIEQDAPCMGMGFDPQLAFCALRRKALAVLIRQPLRWFTRKYPTPSLSPVLKSSRSGSPY